MAPHCVEVAELGTPGGRVRVQVARSVVAGAAGAPGGKGQAQAVLGAPERVLATRFALVAGTEMPGGWDRGKGSPSVQAMAPETRSPMAGVVRSTQGRASASPILSEIGMITAIER